MAVDICMERCMYKRSAVWHTDTLQLPLQGFFLFFFVGGVAKARDREISGFGVHDIKFTKNQQNVKKKRWMLKPKKICEKQPVPVPSNTLQPSEHWPREAQPGRRVHALWKFSRVPECPSVWGDVVWKHPHCLHLRCVSCRTSSSGCFGSYSLKTWSPDVTLAKGLLTGE